MRCAVALCNLDNQVKGFTKDIKFFRFPSDYVLRKAWINACRRLDSFNVNNARVCSKHFEEDCFQRDLKFELIGSSAKNRRSLKPDAIPTLYLTQQIEESESDSRKDHFKKEDETKLVTDILQANQSKIAGGTFGLDDDSSHDMDFKINFNTAGLVDNNPVWVAENTSFTSYNFNTTDVVDNTVCVSRNTESSSYTRRDIGTNTDNENEEEGNRKLKEENEKLKKKLKAVRKIFTPNQIKKLNNPNKRITWTTEDMSRAIDIYSNGARAYKLLLKKGYPLPTVPTLTAWCKQVSDWCDCFNTRVPQEDRRNKTKVVCLPTNINLT